MTKMYYFSTCYMFFIKRQKKALNFFGPWKNGVRKNSLVIESHKRCYSLTTKTISFKTKENYR